MSHDCIQLIYLESEVMSDDEKRVETTSEDWLAFSQTIEQFSKNLDANELVLLKALITQAGAELELLASEVGEEDMHRFQENSDLTRRESPVRRRMLLAQEQGRSHWAECDAR